MTREVVRWDDSNEVMAEVWASGDMDYIRVKVQGHLLMVSAREAKALRGALKRAVRELRG